MKVVDYKKEVKRINKTPASKVGVITVLRTRALRFTQQGDDLYAGCDALSWVPPRGERPQFPGKCQRRSQSVTTGVRWSTVLVLWYHQELGLAKPSYGLYRRDRRGAHWSHE